MNLTQIFCLPHSSSLSLFLPSRPPPTPACCLHHPLPRAALTHRRTPHHICRLHPQPTPTPVSVLTHLTSVIANWLLKCTLKETLCFSSPSLPLRAHIAWCFSAGPGSRIWSAGHESQPGSVLGKITVNNRQSLPTGNRKDGGGK